MGENGPLLFCAEVMFRWDYVGIHLTSPSISSAYYCNQPVTQCKEEDRGVSDHS